jgi:hypothetical protein
MLGLDVLLEMVFFWLVDQFMTGETFQASVPSSTTVSQRLLPE